MTGEQSSREVLLLGAGGVPGPSRCLSWLLPWGPGMLGWRGQSELVEGAKPRGEGTCVPRGARQGSHHTSVSLSLHPSASLRLNYPLHTHTYDVTHTQCLAYTEL